jgi:hypothetical protein
MKSFNEHIAGWREESSRNHLPPTRRQPNGVPVKIINKSGHGLFAGQVVSLGKPYPGMIWSGAQTYEGIGAQGAQQITNNNEYLVASLMIEGNLPSISTRSIAVLTTNIPKDGAGIAMIGGYATAIVKVPNTARHNNSMSSSSSSSFVNADRQFGYADWEVDSPNLVLSDGGYKIIWTGDVYDYADGWTGELRGGYQAPSGTAKFCTCIIDLSNRGGRIDYLVYNSEATEIPDFSLVETDGTILPEDGPQGYYGNIIYSVRKPISNSSSNVLVVNKGIASHKYGHASMCDKDGGIRLRFDYDSLPSPGETCGTMSGGYQAAIGKTGFVILAANVEGPSGAQEGTLHVRPFASGSGIKNPLMWGYFQVGQSTFWKFNPALWYGGDSNSPGYARIYDPFPNDILYDLSPYANDPARLHNEAPYWQPNDFRLNDVWVVGAQGSDEVKGYGILARYADEYGTPDYPTDGAQCTTYTAVSWDDEDFDSVIEHPLEDATVDGAQVYALITGYPNEDTRIYNSSKKEIHKLSYLGGSITSTLKTKASTTQPVGSSTIVVTTAADGSFDLKEDNDILVGTGDNQKRYRLTSAVAESDPSTDATLDITPNIQVELTGGENVQLIKTFKKEIDLTTLSSGVTHNSVIFWKYCGFPTKHIIFPNVSGTDNAGFLYDSDTQTWSAINCPVGQPYSLEGDSTFIAVTGDKYVYWSTMKRTTSPPYFEYGLFLWNGTDEFNLVSLTLPSGFSIFQGYPVGQGFVYLPNGKLLHWRYADHTYSPIKNYIKHYFMWIIESNNTPDLVYSGAIPFCLRGEYCPILGVSKSGWEDGKKGTIYLGEPTRGFSTHYGPEQVLSVPAYDLPGTVLPIRAGMLYKLAPNADGTAWKDEIEPVTAGGTQVRIPGMQQWYWSNFQGNILR